MPITEIAPDCYRLSTYIPEIDLQFNQFLIKDDEPLLFHTGMRVLFPAVREAVASVIDPSTIRWISFSHFEADECGSLNEWLQIAPAAQPVCSMVGALVSVNDFALRPAKGMTDGEVLNTGQRRFRFAQTPHVPHCWEAGVTYEETTGTLLCGDLMTHLGDGPALTTGDIVGPAAAAEDLFHASSIGPATAPTIRKLAALKPRTLGLMHGSSFNGDCTAALHGLADYYATGLQKMAA